MKNSITRFILSGDKKAETRPFIKLLQTLNEAKSSGNPKETGLSHPDGCGPHTYFLKSKKHTLCFSDESDASPENFHYLFSDCSANAVLFFLDAEKKVTTAIKQRLFLMATLGIPHFFLIVHHMEKVKYAKKVFEKIVSECTSITEKLGIADIFFLPASFKNRDNIFEKSSQTSWYSGPALFQLLDNISPNSGKNLVDFRFPVSSAEFTPKHNASIEGEVVSGNIRKDEDILVLPSAKTARIKSIKTDSDPEKKDSSTQKVRLTLSGQIDIRPGDLIVRKKNLPLYDNNLDTLLYWTGKEQLKKGENYTLLHMTREVSALIPKIHYRLDVSSLHRRKPGITKQGDIIRADIKTLSPICFDSYKKNRATGRFILMNTASRQTVAYGFIRGPVVSPDTMLSHQAMKGGKSSNVVWEKLDVSKQQKELQNKHKAAVLWFTGFSGSGKSTIAKALEKKLFSEGFKTTILDGDNVRHGLCGDLGFSDKDRTENIRRVSEVAKLFYEAGMITLCTFISPFKKDREYARKIIPPEDFFEVFVNCSLDECIKRDPKGLYKKAIAGEIKEFTGISSHYEAPENPEIVLETDRKTVVEIVEELFEVVRGRTC